MPVKVKDLEVTKEEVKEVVTRKAAARGIEGGDVKDLELPIITLMQGLSVFVQNNGLRPGTWANCMTKEEVKDTTFIPVIMTKYWDVLKKEGNKMVKDYRVTDEFDERLKDKRFFSDKAKGLPADVNTVLSFISLLGTDIVEIRFTKSSYKTGKKLYTFAKMSKEDLFFNKYKLTSTKETKDGNIYYVAEVEKAGKVTEEEYYLAEEAYNSLRDRAKYINTQGAGEEVPF